MRFVSGLILGLALGAGGMYLALERPWDRGGDAEVASADAGPPDAGEGKRKRGGKRRRKRTNQAASAGEPPVLTAADRAVVTRGDKVALPPRQLDMGEGGDSGRPLTGGEINQTIQAQSRAVLDCIVEARGAAELEANIALKLLVNGNGRVAKVSVRAPAYLFAHGFGACARRAARSFRFPATGAHTVVDAPFELR